MIKWRGIGDVGLGAFGDDGTDISRVTTTRHNPSATSTASLNNMASTSSHLQGTGYGTSSSSVRILFILGPLFCESMFDGLCSSVVHSIPHSIQPSYLRPSSLPYISIVILPTQCFSLLTICPYQFRILYWTSIAISPTFGVSILYLSFLILSTFVTYHIHRSNLFYCAFCNVPAPILPFSCTAFPRIFTFIFCHQTYTDSFQFF